MSRGENRGQAIDEEVLRDEYYAGGGYSLRWPLYPFAKEPIDFHAETWKQLELQGGENIVDVGCGQGGFINQGGIEGHRGLLVGIDLNEELGSAALSAEVNLIIANANFFLPLADNSMDVVTSLFTAYHLRSPEDALRDVVRVLRSGGRLALGTSGPENKKRHREFEKTCARHLGIDPPPIYAQHFDTSKAEVTLPYFFEEIEVKIDQSTVVEITEGDIAEDLEYPEGGVVDAYVTSLKSMSPHFGSGKMPASRLNTPIREQVLSEIRRTIEQEGVFVEPISRKLYICSGPKV